MHAYVIYACIIWLRILLHTDTRVDSVLEAYAVLRQQATPIAAVICWYASRFIQQRAAAV